LDLETTPEGSDTSTSERPGALTRPRALVALGVAALVVGVGAFFAGAALAPKKAAPLRGPVAVHGAAPVVTPASLAGFVPALRIAKPQPSAPAPAPYSPPPAPPQATTKPKPAKPAKPAPKHTVTCNPC